MDLGSLRLRLLTQLVQLEGLLLDLDVVAKEESGRKKRKSEEVNCDLKGLPV